MQLPMAKHTIEVQFDEQHQDQIAEDALRQAALATLEYTGQSEPCELTLVVTTDDALQELNSRFLGIDRPTDVLAFPDDTRGPFVCAPGHPRYLGDVVISLPRAQAQAAEAPHDLEAEVQLLVIHGVLHLLGYDDLTEEYRSAMWAAQRDVVERLGISVQLPE